MADKKLDLKDIRESKGITQIFVAKLLGISRQTLCNKENNRCKWTALEIQKLCNLYNVDISSINLW